MVPTIWRSEDSKDGSFFNDCVFFGSFFHALRYVFWFCCFKESIFSFRMQNNLYCSYFEWVYYSLELYPLLYFFLFPIFLSLSYCFLGYPFLFYHSLPDPKKEDHSDSNVNSLCFSIYNNVLVIVIVFCYFFIPCLIFSQNDH